MIATYTIFYWNNNFKMCCRDLVALSLKDAKIRFIKMTGRKAIIKVIHKKNKQKFLNCFRNE